MVDQMLNPLEEANRVRETSVDVECGFIHPARVKEEEAQITGGTKGIDPQAPWLGAHRPQLRSHQGREGRFLT